MAHADVSDRGHYHFHFPFLYLLLFTTTMMIIYLSMLVVRDGTTGVAWGTFKKRKRVRVRIHGVLRFEGHVARCSLLIAHKIAAFLKSGIFKDGTHVVYAKVVQRPGVHYSHCPLSCPVLSPRYRIPLSRVSLHRP